MIAALVLCAISLAQAATTADRPRNIFDDDWTPPKAAQKPQPPITVPVTQTANPTHSAKPAPANPLTPKTIPAVAPQPPARLAVPAKSAQAATRRVMKEVFAEQLADRSI